MIYSRDWSEDGLMVWSQDVELELSQTLKLVSNFQS